jgi:hypothetical protein
MGRGAGDGRVQRTRKPSWQHVNLTLLRYGALTLVVLGLAMLGVGISGIPQGTAISSTLIPLGFASVIAGIVWPRIEGMLSVGSSAKTCRPGGHPG